MNNLAKIRLYIPKTNILKQFCRDIIPLMNSNRSYSRFKTEFKVRPDDIDMFNHVHNSTYFDYVLAARYEQMEAHYGMSMEEFLSQGFGWVVKTAYVDYKRPLTLGDSFVVETGISELQERGCKVIFTIVNKKTNKICSDGWFDYVLIEIKSGRSARVTPEMIERYSI
ncbi:acyl-CoA thioester hydrolase/thioesterase-3 [Arcticibacter pallidicorallinus]|uniref:Acyl-CoA thioester hydrolase/thioesterase-3 n=2 Tax=Arcticibacter pallidicorallinus TaxID=1259464 RepID=A0A2T0TXG9_9SPHI|nr:acyl-CoA thioester hydrolase/thioesterase-3 [Arcticibacter pallidicorallinus]